MILIFIHHVFIVVFLFRFVLPKHMLLQICEVLPKEMQGILACCNPIPPLVRSELLSLHNIIRSSREQVLNKVSICIVIHEIFLISNVCFAAVC